MRDLAVDVLVVGGGPAGAAAGYWLARSHLNVAVIDRARFPRDKTCGDGLTPRALLQLQEMGVEPALDAFHRHVGLRVVVGRRIHELPWPVHPRFPRYGYAIKRAELDLALLRHAGSAGANVIEGVEAVAPIVANGVLAGATVRSVDDGECATIYARYVVVAEGANSRFGREIGTGRIRAYPMGLAIRGYYASIDHEDSWIESTLDVRDRNGKSLPGYGWVFPLGDGTVNVGIGLLSTYKKWKDVNTTELMREWVATAPAHWGLSPDGAIAKPRGGRLPMAGSVFPKSGDRYVVVGDAAGVVNPFNGEGIDYALETGRLAADAISMAHADDNPRTLQQYEQWLDRDYGLYFRVGRLFAALIGRPALMRRLSAIAVQSKPVMEWLLAIMANLLDEEDRGGAERAYAVAAAVANFGQPTSVIAIGCEPIGFQRDRAAWTGRHL